MIKGSYFKNNYSPFFMNPNKVPLSYQKLGLVQKFFIKMLIYMLNKAKTQGKLSESLNTAMKWRIIPAENALFIDKNIALCL